jgi:hypothetical protein
LSQSWAVEAMYKIQHRHKDGAWADMEEDRSHHDPADHDPERKLGLNRIFRCRTCDESVEIVPDKRYW